MRKLYILFLLTMSLALTGCEKTPSLSLDFYNYEYEMKTLYHISKFYEPKLLTTYDDFRDISFTLDHEPDVLYDEDFFNSNSIYIIPLNSHKEPLFEVRDYAYNDGNIHIEINQLNSFYRTSNLSWDNNYYLVLEIETNDIEDISVEIIEKNDYYKHILYSPEDRLILPDAYQLIFNYNEFMELIDDSIITDKTEVDETLFNNHFIILYTYPGLTDGEDPISLDLFYNESLDIITFRVNIVGTSNLITASNSFSILIVDQSDDISEDTELIVQRAEFN